MFDPPRPTQKHLNTISRYLNKQITGEQFEEACKKDPVLAYVWRNRAVQTKDLPPFGERKKDDE